MNVTSAYNSMQVYQTNQTPATKATLEYETTTSSKTIDKMTVMQEKYKDVYTPIPETYTKESEKLQTAKIFEAYPNYITGQDFLELVNEFYDGEPMKLGQTPTQEQIDKQKIAFDKAYEVVGGEEFFTKMQKDVFIIKDNYPVNPWGKDERNHNETELARFRNAAVYEGLEYGKSVEDAKRNAIFLENGFMISGITETNLLDTLIKIGLADSNTKQDYDNTVNFNAPNNSVWDLREYGIEGRWQENNVYENDQTMILELEKKIGQFNFMLNNENLIEEANNKLDANYQTFGQANNYKEYINEQYLPDAKFVLDIFEDYKIYDSVDIKV